KTAARRLAEAEAVEHVVQAFARQRLGHFRRADVARFRDHAGQVQETVIAHIVDREVADLVIAGRRVDLGLRRPFAAFEPGSTTSVTARLRRYDGSAACAFGLNEGWLTIARISPLLTSSTTIDPELAWCSRIWLLSSRYARYWMRRSIDNVMSRPGFGSRASSTSSTVRPRRSRITRSAPGLPASQSSNASSSPSWP